MRHPLIQILIDNTKGRYEKQIIKQGLNFALGNLLIDKEYNDPELTFQDEAQEKEFEKWFYKYIDREFKVNESL